MKSVYIFLLLTTCMLWSNARMLEKVSGYKTFNVLSLPREFRFVELVLVVGSYVYARSKRGAASTWLEKIVRPEALFFIGFLSGIYNPVPLADTLQGLFIFISPMMVYFTARWMKFGNTEIRTLQLWMLAILVLNLPAWLYQIFAYPLETEEFSFLCRNEECTAHRVLSLSLFLECTEQ